MKKILANKGIEKFFDEEKIRKEKKQKKVIPIAILSMIISLVFHIILVGKNIFLFKIINSVVCVAIIQIGLYVIACYVLNPKTQGAILCVVRLVFKITWLLFATGILILYLLEKMCRRLKLDYVYRCIDDLFMGLVLSNCVAFIILTALKASPVVHLLEKIPVEQAIFLIWALIFLGVFLTLKFTIRKIANKMGDVEQARYEITQEVRACVNLFLLISLLFIYAIPMDSNKEVFWSGYVHVSEIWLLYNTIGDQTVYREVTRGRIEKDKKVS